MDVSGSHFVEYPGVFPVHVQPPGPWWEDEDWRSERCSVRRTCASSIASSPLSAPANAINFTLLHQTIINTETHCGITDLKISCWLKYFNINIIHYSLLTRI